MVHISFCLGLLHKLCWDRRQSWRKDKRQGLVFSCSNLSSLRALERVPSDGIGAGDLVSITLGALPAMNSSTDGMEGGQGNPTPNSLVEARDVRTLTPAIAAGPAEKNG